MVDTKILVYRTNQYTYDFKYLRTRNTFGRDIYNRKITLKEDDEDQSSLLVVIMNFKKRPKPKNPEKNKIENIFLKNLYDLFEGRERVLNAFDSKIFVIKIGGTCFSHNIIS